VQIAETEPFLSVGDGVARIYGLQDAMAGEMVEFPGGIFGVILNLEEQSVGVAGIRRCFRRERRRHGKEK